MDIIHLLLNIIFDAVFLRMQSNITERFFHFHRLKEVDFEVMMRTDRPNRTNGVLSIKGILSITIKGPLF